MNQRKRVHLENLLFVQFTQIALLLGRQIYYCVQKSPTFGPVQNQVIQSTSPYLITFWLDSLLLFEAYFFAWPRPITWSFTTKFFFPIYLISITNDKCMSVTLELLPTDKKIHWVYLKRTWEKETTWRPRRRWEDKIKMKWDVGVWIGSNWIRIGTGGGHLWMH